MLDDKLREILFKAAGGISDMAEEEIAQIKEVCYGFHDKTAYVGVFPNLKSGEEWYERFEEELQNIPHVPEAQK